MIQMKTPKLSYTFDYDTPIELAETQRSVFWTAEEIEVKKDIQDILVNMTEAETHGILTTLKLFTLYELIVGKDYWMGRVLRKFPRPDIQQMAATFGFIELGIHAPFYNKINEALRVNTDDFYLSYLDDPVLKARMEFVESLVTAEDDFLSVGAFSMIEGAVLYSAFAFLKSFQAHGKNKIVNIVRGIDFSVRDENLHCIGGAWIFRQMAIEEGGLPEGTEEKLQKCAQEIYEHEARICDMIFEKGDISGINKEELKSFVKSRLNLALENLGLEPVFVVEYNPIADWFYDAINSLRLHDFFTGVGSEYNRNWDETRFGW